jgi:hypothetical protein
MLNRGVAHPRGDAADDHKGREGKQILDMRNFHETVKDLLINQVEFLGHLTSVLYSDDGTMPESVACACNGDRFWINAKESGNFGWG